MHRPILDRLRGTIARDRLFVRGQRVGVAVSGGADSIFLLHALRELAPEWALRLGVVHIEHGIRGPESGADAAFVAGLAAGFSLPFHLREADVPALGENVEQAARRVRHAFFAELTGCGLLDRIATGHTRQDQAETVLYRLLRGAGLAGLSGILPATREGLVRPLLEIDRACIEAWLRERGIAWREDATNLDLRYARNRLRREILPALRAAFNPKLDEALGRLAALARDEESYWAEKIDRDQGHPGQGHIGEATAPVILAVADLRGPPAPARRRARRAIESAKGDLRGIGFEHVEAVLAMAGPRDGHGRAQLPGVEVVRSFEWMRFAPPRDCGTRRDFSLRLAIPGWAELPGSGGGIALERVEAWEEAREPCATLEGELDWQRLTSSAPDAAGNALELRNWRPGDQYRRAGQTRGEKLKFLFQQFRVPVWERGSWPVIARGGEIVWARRFGAAAAFAAGAGARVRVRVVEAKSAQKPNREDGL